jgi:hypothetical protein
MNNWANFFKEAAIGSLGVSALGGILESSAFRMFATVALVSSGGTPSSNAKDDKQENSNGKIFGAAATGSARFLLSSAGFSPIAAYLLAFSLVAGASYSMHCYLTQSDNSSQAAKPSAPVSLPSPGR